MAQIKMEFHEDMDKLESLFEKYKKSYPTNYGEMARETLPWFVLLLGILMLIHSSCLYGRLYGENVLVVSSCVVAPFMICIGVMMLRSTGGTHSSGNYEMGTRSLNQLISSAKKKYADYPDVMEYLAQLKAVYDVEIKRKKTLKIKFWLVFWVGVSLYASMVLYDFVYAYYLHNY